MTERFGLIGMAGLALMACGREQPEPAGPDIQTREIEYRQNGTVLKGFIAWDSAQAGQRPGVLVVHEWWGLNEHARNAARRLAEAGYVGLALDMYGDGKVTTHPDTAPMLMAEATRDPAVLNARFAAAREELLKDPHVDPERVGAIGYCFGGMVVLSQARAGADLDAVVDSFRASMAAAGANFEIVSYPGAKHSFTNPQADAVGMPALAYNAEADRQSWEAMLRLFREVWP